MIMVPPILNANLISLGITVTLLACMANKFMSSKRPTIKLSARYWRELWPNSPTYARFPNLLYTAELCI